MPPTPSLVVRTCVPEPQNSRLEGVVRMKYHSDTECTIITKKLSSWPFFPQAEPKSQHQSACIAEMDVPALWQESSALAYVVCPYPNPPTSVSEVCDWPTCPQRFRVVSGNRRFAEPRPAHHRRQSRQNSRPSHLHLQWALRVASVQSHPHQQKQSLQRTRTSWRCGQSSTTSQSRS